MVTRKVSMIITNVGPTNPSLWFENNPVLSHYLGTGIEIPEFTGGKY